MKESDLAKKLTRVVKVIDKLVQDILKDTAAAKKALNELKGKEE